MATLQGQYKAAIKHGLLDQSVTEEQFAGILGDPKQRKAYYDNSNKIKQGAYGTYESFSKAADDILAAYRQPQAPAAEQAVAPQEVPTMPIGAAADSTDAAVAMLMDSNRKQQEQDKKERARINNAQLPMSDEDNQREERIRTIDNTLKQVGVDRFANRQPIGDAREEVLQQQQQLEQERTALQGQRKSYMKEPETVEEARESWANAWMENTEEGKQAKREADAAYQQAVDYLRNEFVKSKAHQDIVADVQRKYNSGALTEDEANAELNKRLNDAFIAENKETLEAEYQTLYGGLAQRAYKADNGWLQKQEERIGTKAVQEAIDEGVDELNEAMRADYEAFSKTVGNSFGAAQAKSNYINTQQAGILGAASQLYQETETILKSTVKGDEKFGTLTSEILRHSKDKLANLASFGMSDVNYSAYQAGVLKKIADAGAYDNPESVLDRNEQVLYNAIVSNVAAQLLRAENTSHLANAGKLTADMLPFVRDIIMGKGLLGGFSAAAEKGIMRGIVRSIGTGKWGKLLANLGKTGVGLVESTAISLISPSTYQQVFKQEAQIDPTSLHLTDEGWKVDKIDQKHAIDAFAAAHVGMTKELFTETGGMTQFAIRLAQASPLGKYLRKTKIGQIAQMFDNTIAGKLFNQTAYHGFAAELSEEWENTFYDAVFAAMNNDNAGKRMEAFGKVYGEFVKPETQVPMLISFALPAIFGGAVSTGQIITINSQYKQAYENLRNTYMKYGATEEEFEDALNELRAARMNMNIEDYPQLIRGLAATLSGGSQEQADEFATALSAYTVADANLGAIQEKHAKKQRQVQQLIRDIQASEERITSNTHADSGMMYHVNVNGQAGYVVSGVLDLRQTANAELPVAFNTDVVTVRMEDGSVKQVAARDVQLLEQPQAAEGAMEFERRRLTARMNNLDRFKVGDVIYITENGQPIDGSSSRVVDVTDEGVVAEIYDPNGQPNTTVIPHEVAESGLSTSDELVEDGAESMVLEMNGGSLITMQKTTSGDWMQVAPKTDSMTLLSQRELNDMIAEGGAKIVNGEQMPSVDVASGNGVVSGETSAAEQPVEQPVEQTSEQPAKPYATDEQGNPIWAELDVEQSVSALLSEMEDDKELSKQFAQSQIAAAKSALNKANKRKPQATTDLATFRAEAQAIKQEQQAAQAELSKWESVLLGIANYKTAEEQAAADQAVAQPESAVAGTPESDGEKIGTQSVEQIKLTDGRVVTLSTITDKDFALLGDITPIQRSLIAVKANAVQNPDLKLKTAGYCNTTRQLLFNELPSEKKDLPTLRDIYFRTQQEYVNTPNKTQEYRFAADGVLKEIRRRLSYVDPENYPPKQGSASVSRLNDAELAVAEAETDTNPTEAQKKAENYKQGHVTLWGLPFTIENPKGSVRRGTDANGKQWESVMNNTYGKIRRTEGVDGDHIDVFFGPNLQSDKVFVVDQLNVDTKEFDEHKVMLGFDSMEEAQAAYLSNYEQGWQGMGPVTETTMDEFKKWIESSHRKTKPFIEYKSVKQEGAASGVTTPAQKSVNSGKKASNKTEKTQGSVQNSVQVEQKNAESNEKTQESGKNTVFTDEMLEAARQRMRSRMNRLNAGIDPEMLADGIVFAGYYVEKGVRKFADFAKNMIAEFGESIRPYLKAFYNGLRDMPEAQAFVSEMDDYASVAAIDVNTITLDEQVQPSANEVQPSANEVQPSANEVQPSTEQVQPKQVSVEGLFNDLKTKGETKLSDNVVENEPIHIKNYREIKEQYPDALVLFRAGDFYEVYLEDAQEASKILGITLTKTGNYSLAGFPFHALDSYLPKLVRAGKRVAIAEKVKNKPEVVETVENQPNLAQNLQESEKNSNFAENIGNNEQNNENLREGVEQINAEPSEVRGGAEESTRGTARTTTDDGRGDGRVRSLASTLSTLGDKTAQEEYLKQSDLWLSPNEIEISRDLSKGKESQVYVSKDKKAAIKLVDYSIYSETPFDFVRDRIELFNQLFPKTAYTIVGVTERNGKLNFVLSQPLIRGKVLEDSWWGQGLEVYESFKPRLDEMMRERFGMENYGLDAYQNELIRVQDLHYKNIIVDENGEWQVVDAVTTYREAPEDKGTKKDEPLIITDAVGEITKSTDTRDGSDIWLVNPTDRVSKEEFAELKKRAKAHNGYYSNFKQNRGFLFRTEEDAIAFNRINENELTTDEVLADTGLVIGEAETRRNEAETIAENTRVEPSAPTTGEAIEQVTKAEQQINAAMAQVDEATEQVNDQLMLLGYYKSESDANEWGLSKKAEKAALKDVNKVANQLAKDLGIEGKIKASANIAPAGGDITFRIPLQEGRELYVCIPIVINGYGEYYNINGDYADLYIPESGRQNSLVSSYILYRLENPSTTGIGRYGTNYYADTRTTYDNFLLDVRYIAKAYLPEQAASQPTVAEQPQELQTPLEKAKARPAKHLDIRTAPQPAMGDLFAGTLFAVNEIEESINQQNTQNDENEQQPTRRTGSSEPTTGDVRSSDGQQSAGVRSEDTIQEDTRPTDGGGAAEMPRDEREESRSGLPLHAIEQEPLPDNQKKNKRNNNVKRGVDYAPKTTKERFEANVAAIQLLKELEESGKQATSAQMKVLRKFTGWGGLGSFFPEGYISTTSDAGKLKQLLTPEEYDAANLSRNSAYFTPGAVIDRLWDIAAKFGFKGGNITEGSAGTGEILARIPQAMNERSEILAVEIDPITGGILKQLYPDARVEIDGFQNVSIPNGSQDLVITNVPFVRDLRVFDKEESDLSKRFTQIQDFCIAKNIRKLREGGLGIFIAGKSSLDSSKDLRKWIVKEGNCDVVGAFRLNKDTFNGTSATADIIVVKKRVNGVVSPNAIDILDVETIKVDEVEVDTTYNSKTRTWDPVTKRVALAYNKHYVQHPEDMGGEMELGKDEGDTRFGGGSSACYPRRNINQMQRLDEWIANMGKGESMMPAPVLPTELKNYENTLAPQGSIILNSKDEVCIANRGKAEPLDVNSNKVKGQTKQQVVKDYLALKRIVHELLEVQESGTDAEVKSYQKVLNERYDSFVKKYGYLNKNAALSFLRNDVEYPSIAAIEKYEEIETPKGKEVKVEKTDIFKKRVIGVKSEPTPTNTRDAVVLSVQQFGRLDLAQMAQWLNMSEEAVREDIVKERLGFVNPETQQLQIRHEYLSGNVRQKLAYAQAHNENGEYTTNIEELQKVIPMDIPAHLIEFSLGSTWIDPKMYEDFVREKYDVTIKYSHIGGVWSENGSPYLAKEKNRAAGVHSDLLNMHVFGNELFISAMNNVPYIVSKQETYYEGGQKKTRTVTDKNASQACATRIDEIRDEFTEWARQHMQQDAELAQRMERVYNDKFNAIVPMDIDEQFTQAFLPGMNPNTFPLYPIQQKAIVRGTMQPVLLAHEVGTGKTRSLICTAMEMRRLGTAKKPLIVVQNATVMQFVNEAKELFPNAKVLTVNEKDRTSEGRREFYAKIKYNDWDMVIVPQSVFDMIPDSDDRKRDFIQEKVDEKLHVLEMAKEADMDSRQIKNLERELNSLREDVLDLNLSGKKQSKKDSKKEQVRKETAEARAEEMLERRTDDVADFDQMGIDALLVDEAHNYKHLGFATMMQRGVKGIDPSYSKRAAALYLKVQSVFEQSGGKNVVFATGTPISNTAAEIWTFMKYLMPKEVMQENDIYYFDDFVRNFGKISQSLEFATNGKFKENTRFASYVNIPELARIWGQITDTRLTDEVKTTTGRTLKDEKIPAIEGGKQTDIFLEQSDSLVDIMNAVRSRLEEYENMSGSEKKENSHIPLTMYGIAKRAAIDPRLVDATAKDEPESKTNKAVEETLRALKDSKKYNGTVAIFCDNYRRVDTINDKRVEGFNIFEEIRNKLIQRGVPADQIVIMKSGMTDKAKQQVFDAMNAGSKRVILGSTQTLGTGVNIQTRLFTLIHMDAPDRPMDMTQREGRILRQGNMHKIMGIPVRILRFGVKDSLDVTGYQRLQTKSRFIDSIMRSKDTLNNNQEGRVIEEDEEGLYDNPVAVLSGSQYALLKSQAEREYRKLLSKQQQHNADQIYIENQLRNNALSNKRDEDYVAGSRKRLAEIEKLFPNGKPKAIVVNGVKTTSNESLEKAVKEYNKILYAQQKQFEGQYNYGEDKRDLKLTVSFDGTPFDITIELKKRSEFENGQRKVKMEKRVFYSCTPLNIEKTPADNTVSLQRVIEEIRDKELSGMYDRQRVEAAEQRIARRISDNEEMQKRCGKQFELTDELAAAKKRVDEYTELMRQELAEQEAKYANRGTGAAVDLDAARDTEDESGEAEMMIVDSYNDAEAELTEAQQLIFDGLAEVAADAGIDMVEVSEEEAQKAIENSSNKPLTNPINGKILGYAQGGTIYLTKAGMTPETVVHEYTHVWAKAMQRNNRAGWENIMEIFKQSPLWEYVKNDPNYKDRLTTDDAICSEVLARFSSKQGADRLDEVAREFIYEEQQKGGTLGSARVRHFINHARQAIKSFWKWVGKNLFGITKFDSMEDVADRVLYDLLNATKLDVDNNDKTVEASIERPSAEFVEAMRAWNDANPYPIYTEGESLRAFSNRLNDWKEAREAYRRSLLEAAIEERESADPITEPMVAGSKPMRKNDETAREYAQRLKQYHESLIDRKLAAEYTAEMNRLANSANKIKRAFIDAALPIEEWQNWLIAQGAKISGESNAYQDMFLAQGRVTDAADKLRRNIIQKLASKIGEIIDSKKLDDIDLRWHNMDVPGTNRTINGNQLTARELIGVYCQAKDCEEAEEKGLPDRGQAGFRNNLNVEYTDIVNAVETRLSREDITELWYLINQATKYALEYDFESGRISKDTFDEFQDRDYYVPQRGWRERDESGLIEEYEPVGKRGHDPYNAALIKARGRQTLAADPFAYIMSIDHSSIVSSENNKIKQKMLNFCLENEQIGLETGAFRVKKYWLMHEIDPETGKLRRDMDGNPIVNISYTEPSAEEKKNDKKVKDQIKRIQKDIAAKKKQLTTPNVGPRLEAALQAMIDRWEKQIADLEDTIVIAWGATNTNISQRTRDEKAQHEVVVMKDGQRYVIELQDEKVANAINKRFKSHQEALFNVSDKIRNATRFMSAMLTQYNPEFAFSNFVRDFQVAAATLSAENPKLLPAFMANFAKCQRAVWAYAFNDRVRDRKKFVSTEMGRYLQEYMASGAPTGFSYMQDLKSLRKDFDNMVQDGNFKRGIRAAAGTFALLTEWSETAVRFAAYVSARQAGWSVNDAAYMSKELTTNFDRAGEMADSGWMAWFSFFRATLNGNIKFFRAFKKFPIAYSIVAAAYFAAGLANQLANPNDPDDEVWASEYIRENNLIIGKWRIPVAHFMRIFYSAGVNLASWGQGNQSFGHAVYNSTMSATREMLPNYMNIPGNFTEWDDEMSRVAAKDPKAVIRDLAPTAISPIVDVWANRNFMGGTVNREPFVKSQSSTKDILLAKDNTLPIYRAITEGLYTAVGGDLTAKYKMDDNALTGLLDISGSSVEHVVEGYLTGGMDLLGTTANLIYDVAQGNEITPDKLPFIRKFYNYYSPQRAYDQQYWLLKGIVQEYERMLNDYEDNNPDKYKLETRSKQYKAYEDTNELIREKIENPTTEDVKQLIEANKKWIKARK